jgi:hypothetical protein
VPDQASQPAAAPGQASSRSASTANTKASAAHTNRPAAHATSPAAHPTSAAGQSKKPAAAAQPYLIYDSLLPGALPSGHVVATYATGPGAVSPAALAGRGPVLWIDVNGTDPGAQVLDVEPGNVTPAAIPGWISAKLSARPSALAIIYSAINEWPAAQAEVATLPAAMRAQVRWWIADPTGYQHIVPGSDATQWYWGSSYDVSTATLRFLSGRTDRAALTWPH